MMAALWLIGGYALIVLSYAFVWGMGTTFSQCSPSQKLCQLAKDDVAAVVAMMLLWTSCWGVIEMLEVIR